MLVTNFYCSRLASFTLQFVLPCGISCGTYFSERQVMVKVTIERPRISTSLKENFGGDRHSYTSDKFSKSKIYSPSSQRTAVGSRVKSVIGKFTTLSRRDFLLFFTHLPFLCVYIMNAILRHITTGDSVRVSKLFTFEHRHFI